MGERLFETKTEEYVRTGLTAGLKTTGAIFVPPYESVKPVVAYVLEKAGGKVARISADNIRLKKARFRSRRLSW